MEPSGDACNSFELWPSDLDLVNGLGLNAYRFSIEWARIEPEPGQFSRRLDHYRRIDRRLPRARPRARRDLQPLHQPALVRRARRLAEPGAPALFARYCERAARHLGDGIGDAVTLNEPNLHALLNGSVCRHRFLETQRATLAAAEAAAVAEATLPPTSMNAEDLPRARRCLTPGTVAGAMR